MKVTLKIASTLDGKIATVQGNSQWITGDTARKKGHELRNTHDAILVGVNTVIADNPRLTTRHMIDGKSPVRVILDSHGRIPSNSHCLEEDGISVVLVVGCDCPPGKLQQLQREHVRLLRAPTPKPEPQWVLSQLEKFEISTVLVEGGSQVHASFIKAKLVDQLVMFLAPKIIGGQNSLSWCGDLGIFQMHQSPRFRIDSFQLFGDDLMICASPCEETSYE